MAEKSQLAKNLESAANIAIVLLAFVIAGVLLKQAKSPRQELRHVEVGSHFGLNNIDWQKSPQHLVFALSTTCHFCTESAPFYRRLVEECKRRHVPTIAVLPQPIGDSKSYLQNEGVIIDSVVQSQLADIEISGTPTLVLVDAGGIARGAWVGKLSTEKEQELMSRLQP
jgi:hypothetical protein